MSKIKEHDWLKVDRGFRCTACGTTIVSGADSLPGGSCFGPPLRIRVAGYLSDEMVLKGHLTSCGPIRNGVDVEFVGQQGRFVIDWADFEAAYLALKATREEAERIYEESKRLGRLVVP
jgi:hypothetical protein